MTEGQEVVGCDYDADRDRRWREIVSNFCVLADENEADSVVPRLLRSECRKVLEVGSHWGPVAERVAAAGAWPVCLELDPDVVTE